PGREPDDQDHQHRGAAAAGRPGPPGRRRVTGRGTDERTRPGSNPGPLIMRQAIAPDGLISHISGMQKTSNRLAKTGQYASVGRAADGVVILRPAVPPKH